VKAIGKVTAGMCRPGGRYHILYSVVLFALVIVEDSGAGKYWVGICVIRSET